MKFSPLCAILLGLAVFFTGSVLNAQISFDPSVNYAAGDLPDSAALGDFNGDGIRDIAVTSDNPDKVSLFFNLGSGTFGTPVTVLLPSGSGAAAIVAGNLDVDTDVDLAVALKNLNSIQILLNDGSGTFSLGSSFGVGSEPSHMVAGDLDGNNFLDLVSSNRDDNTVSVLLNSGAANFPSIVNYTVGQDPRGVTLGDFDGTNGLDIAVSAHDDRAINLLSNNGSGAYSAGVTLSTGAQLRPEGVVAADLDCNGNMDLAASTSGNTLNFASVYLGNGNGTFGTRTDYAVGGVDPGAIVAADFDLDGDPDLATANQTSNNVSALAGNGTGVFGAAVLFAVGTSPEQLAVGHLDGNGGKDLVAVNKDSDNISVLINQDSSWIDLGLGLAGTTGVPVLTGSGAIESGETLTLSLANAIGNAKAFIIVGTSRIDLPFMGGTFVPAPTLIFGSTTSAVGSLTLSGPTPAGMPKGLSYFFQVWIEDAGAVMNYAGSNGLEGRSQ